MLVGGLEHFLFSHILGIIIPIDYHIFQRGGPTTNQHEFVSNMGYFTGCRDARKRLGARLTPELLRGDGMRLISHQS